MKKILVTGGTTFVSRYTAEYFVQKGCDVTVLNRGSRPQSPGVRLIQADRHRAKEVLKGEAFDAVLDITAYTKEDIADLLDGLDSFDRYIMLSSSAVYPEYGRQPFREDEPLAANRFWGAYGTNKIAAESELLNRVPDAYILRPPYLYGAMNNLYREAFVFECALRDRAFYLPGDGSMKLQFFHVRDLCRVMELCMEKKPDRHILNTGNREPVSVQEWVRSCYRAAGREPRFVNVPGEIEQRLYFSFYNYEYYLDVSGQYELMEQVMPLEEGLKDSFLWYTGNKEQVATKPYMEYIDRNLTNLNRS